MSLIRRRRCLAGMIFGLGAAGSASAQGIPEALPPLPNGPAAIAPAGPVVIPTPNVIAVPPGGMAPTWAPYPLDPVTLEKFPPKHIPKKERSWGWRRLQGKFLGYPEDFIPRPLGAAVYDNNRIMVANAAGAKLVLHRFDFEDGSAELNARGQDQLARLTLQLASSPFPLLIERTPEDPGLAEGRRLAVLAHLARGPCPMPSDRVLVGAPIPAGMSGIDAQIIGNNAIGRTQQYGPPIPINSNGVNSPSGVTSNTGLGGP